MNSTKHLLFVLGMHRSGTSILAGTLHSHGIVAPGRHLSATTDNPYGYWEPQELVEINNKIMALYGRSWFDDRPLDCEAGLGDSDLREVNKLLEQWTLIGNELCLKDPRLCRLLPIWRSAASSMTTIKVVIIVRNPFEVARSLARRNNSPAHRPAAVLQLSRALLLWSAYNLEAERYSRELERHTIDYTNLVQEPVRSLQTLWRVLNLPLQAPDANEHSILGRKNEQTMPAPAWPLSSLAAMHKGLCRPDAHADFLDVHFRALTQAQHRFSALRKQVPAAPKFDQFADDVLQSYLYAAEAQLHQLKHVAFLSGEPLSKGHIYRVERSMQYLESQGVCCDLLPSPSPPSSQMPPLPNSLQAIIQFRGHSTPFTDPRLAQARQQGVVIIFDIDDAVFEPRLMTPQFFAYLRHPSSGRRNWAQEAGHYQDALVAADHVFVTTEPLATLARQFHPSVYVIPNGLADDQGGINHDQCEARKQDALVVIGYASGTPTHQADFASAATAIARVLKRHKNARLRIVGSLDVEEFEELSNYTNQIEKRPLVPLSELHRELQQFDINIAPLEVGNPFCESKSELKYFEAAAVGIPTIASATAPMTGAIKHGVNGWLVQNEEDWENTLNELINRPGHRHAVARRARAHALARFGADARGETLLASLNHVLKKGSEHRPATIDQGTAAPS